MRKGDTSTSARKGRFSDAGTRAEIGVLAANQEHAFRAQDEMRGEIRAVNEHLKAISERLGKTATSEEVRQLESRLGEVRLLSEKLEGSSVTNTAEIEKLKAQVELAFAELAKKADSEKVDEQIKPLTEQRTRMNTLWMGVQFLGFGGLATLIAVMGVVGNKAAPQPAQYPPAVIQAPTRATPAYDYPEPVEDPPPSPRPRRRAPAATANANPP